tara:strand:- start:4512 stop:5441 length:930 start_codon:yes stop_codon:yes gene_type:complete
MKVPTTGTEVFAPVAFAGNSVNRTISAGFTTDMVLSKGRNSGLQPALQDRLRGAKKQLLTSETDAESSPASGLIGFDSMVGVNLDGASGYWNTTYNYIEWMFRRAPGFFDEVCYTGTGSAMTLNHNLGVVPEMMIVKSRSAGSTRWCVYHTVIGNNLIFLDADRAVETGDAAWNNQVPTSSVFYIGTYASVNAAARTFVNYLFATCPGVSKVGSYTGTGTTQIIDCGFTTGARFVLIKRISGTNPAGGWYVWDSARGMVSGTDPSLLLNSTAAEVNANSIYAITTGFQIVSTAAGINASGSSYIFLSIS